MIYHLRLPHAFVITWRSSLLSSWALPTISFSQLFAGKASLNSLGLHGTLTHVSLFLHLHWLLMYPFLDRGFAASYLQFTKLMSGQFWWKTNSLKGYSCHQSKYFLLLVLKAIWSLDLMNFWCSLVSRKHNKKLQPQIWFFQWLHLCEELEIRYKGLNPQIMRIWLL